MAAAEAQAAVSASESEASETSTVCGICFHELSNPRLLSCLHSFCCSCIDRLAVTVLQPAAEDDERKIGCPVCRSVCRFPDGGAIELPKDFPRPAEKNKECGSCKQTGDYGEAVTWCVQCTEAFCATHTAPHIISTGHSLSPPPSNVTDKTTTTMTECETCTTHEKPNDLFCVRCDVTICGHCLAVGDHSGHKPVMLLKDMICQRKQAVMDKVNKMKTHILPRSEKAVQDIDEVSEQLSSRADGIRRKINLARQRTVHTIEACFEQKLLEVDNVVLARQKILVDQRDELKSHVLGMKNAISFSERLSFGDRSNDKESGPVLALDDRVTALTKCEIALEPKEHSCLEFVTVDDDELIVEVQKIVGMVSHCDASANHSRIKGKKSVFIKPGQPAAFVLQGKDKLNKILDHGGDIIKAIWSQEGASELVEEDSEPDIVIEDNGDGTYAILCTPYHQGEYRVDVTVNGINLPFTLSIYSAEWQFDPSTCHKGNTISQDRQSVTHSGGDGWSNLLGCNGMRWGHYDWKVRVSSAQGESMCSGDHFIGIVSKTNYYRNQDNFKISRSWNNRCRRCVLGRIPTTEVMSPWQNGDNLHLVLDCDHHTLTITNQRSGETDTIDSLPDQEFYQYFSLWCTGSSISFSH